MTGVFLTQQFMVDWQKFPEADRRRITDATLKIQLDPENNGLNPEKIKKSKDCWSYRATQDIRIVARRSEGICSLIAVDRHDRAYARAESGNLDGAVDAALIAKLKASASPLPAKQPLSIRRGGPLSAISDEVLREAFGIPTDLIDAVRALPDADALWQSGFEDVISVESFEALERVLPKPSVVSTGGSPVYRLPNEALARAFAEGTVLNFQFNLPTSSWAIVESQRRHPLLIKGGPGSGKTLVALYRALHVLEADRGFGFTSAPRVLYVTYTNQLCDDARHKIERLRGTIPDGLTIATYDAIATKLAAAASTTPVMYPKEAHILLDACAADAGLDPTLIRDEVSLVIQARNIRARDEYLAATRRGRGKRLTAADRLAIWGVYERYLEELKAKRTIDLGTMRMRAAERAATLTDTERYDFVIVDEVQDLPLPALLMVTNLAKGDGQNKHLMFVGDAGQAIYNRGFRWTDAGLRFGGTNVQSLAQSERSTLEILEFAKALFGNVPAELAQVESPASSKHGERPRLIANLSNDENAHEWLVADIARRIQSGVPPEAIAIIGHSHNRLAAVGKALRSGGFSTVEQGSATFYARGSIKLITAHAAKGLEFSEVYLPDVNDGVYPFFKNKHFEREEREDRDVQDCQLLYVAASRAADRLTVLYDREPSPFLASARAYATIVSAS